MQGNEMTPERIRAICEALELTQAEVAERIGVHPRHFRKYLQQPGTPNYRRPGGSARILLENLEREAKRATRKMLGYSEEPR